MNNDILLDALKHRPEPYEPGTPEFWDDGHISKSMLETHLDPDTDAATRKPDFVRRSARWIAGYAGGRTGPRLLDLGCGPGIYAELFHGAGFGVTGIDISRRSVGYAQAQAAIKGLPIEYVCGNYLDLGYDSAFDIITLIYCDFGVLAPDDRAELLGRIHKALKPGGRFIVDVCSPRQYEGRPESASWSFSDGGGFWSAGPYACLYSFLRYDDVMTFADRYIIVGKNDIRCFNIWNHRFSAEELRRDLIRAGFSGADLFDTVAGDAFTDAADTVCAVAVK
jgi:SAM-dependent methyltransferase